MNAGEINIAVTASMNQFNATMSAVKQSAADTASSTGAFFRNKLKDEFSEQKAGKVLGSVLGLGMADNMMRSASAAIRGDKSIGEAVNELVSNLPVIGGAFELGKSIGERIADKIYGATSLAERQRIRAIELAYEAEMKAALDLEEKKTAAEKKRIAEVRKAQEQARKEAFERELGFQNFNADQEKQLAQDRADFIARTAIQAAKEAGNAEEALRLEMEKTVADERQKLMEGFGAGQVVASEEEREAFKRLVADRETLIRDEFDMRLALLRKEEAERKKADEERIAEMKKKMEDEISSLEDQRVSAAQAGVGSSQTALGSFKFDAYPASAKRQNDEKLVRAIETIRDQQKAGGFV